MFHIDACSGQDLGENVTASISRPTPAYPPIRPPTISYWLHDKRDGRLSRSMTLELGTSVICFDGSLDVPTCVA